MLQFDLFKHHIATMTQPRRKSPGPIATLSAIARSKHARGIVAHAIAARRNALLSKIPTLFAFRARIATAAITIAATAIAALLIATICGSAMAASAWIYHRWNPEIEFRIVPLQGAASSWPEGLDALRWITKDKPSSPFSSIAQMQSDATSGGAPLIALSIDEFSQLSKAIAQWRADPQAPLSDESSRAESKDGAHFIRLLRAGSSPEQAAASMVKDTPSRTAARISDQRRQAGIQDIERSLGASWTAKPAHSWPLAILPPALIDSKADPVAWALALTPATSAQHGLFFFAFLLEMSILLLIVFLVDWIGAGWRNARQVFTDAQAQILAETESKALAKTPHPARKLPSNQRL